MPKVFISYSRKDAEWKDKLMEQLGVLEQTGQLTQWSDDRIQTGGFWRKELEEALQSCDIAILLISASFLTSEFILDEEIPTFLQRRQADGMKIVPILVRPCAWKSVEWLAPFQLEASTAALSGLSEHEQEQIFSELATNLINYQTRSRKTPNVPKTDPKIETTRYPSISNPLYGRSDELQLLDEAWENPNLRVLSFIAMGGTGKTALIHEWMNRMRDDDWRGAKRVYAWSFYSQGASEDRQASSDAFINEALQFFGDAELAASPASGYEKGKRLATLFGESRTLLLLDGLEPLQHPPGELHGKLKDQGMQGLLRALLNQPQGLCLISSRIAVSELQNKGKRSHSHDLRQLDEKTGAALLEKQYQLHPKKALKPTVREYKGHALALNLLGSYLKIAHNGDLNKRQEIPDLFEEEKNGGHAMRVMQSYAHYFKDKAELEVLHLLGLFDRPVEMEVIEILKNGIAEKKEEKGFWKKLFSRPKPNPIANLTSKIARQSPIQWEQTLNHLRELSLLGESKLVLDCHPLIRTYFGEQLQKDQSEAWKAAHERLYEYYAQKPEKHLPDTIEEMEPLFLAVRHGCLAGKYQAAFNDIFWERICRSSTYIVNQLGAFGPCLSVLSHFFEKTWNKPLSIFGSNDYGNLFNKAGFTLRALGRLNEAIQPFEVELEMSVKDRDWKGAAEDADNLSELYLAIGDIQNAIEYGQKGVEYADESENEFQKAGRSTTLANAYLQAGEFSKAKALFEKAEQMLKAKSEYKYLYSLSGYRYCNLLLQEKAYQEILQRANYTIVIAKRNNWLLDIALDTLCIGKAHLLQENYEEAKTYLQQAVADLRKAGDQDELPLGLLARAAYHRATKNYPAAWEDLAEVLEIAEYGVMRLHLTDYYLEAARVLRHQVGHTAAPYHTQVEGEKRALTQVEAQAQYQAWVAEVAQLIQATGYHRRDAELEDLQNKPL